MTSDGKGMQEAKWYAVQVRPNHEQSVAAILRFKGYEEYVPLYSQTKGNRPTARFQKLFPGYVFCRFSVGSSDRVLNGSGVVTTQGVLRIIGAGKTAIPIEDAEIQTIQRATVSEAPCAPCAFLSSGQRVQIDAGPLRGISGILVSAEGISRLVLSIDLLHRSMAVTVDRQWVSTSYMERN